MSIRKRRRSSGSIVWQARVKSGGVEVAAKTFALKRDAEAWEAAQKRQLALGDWLDPNLGKESLKSAWERREPLRVNSISPSALITDAAAFKRLPPSPKNRPVAAFTAGHFERFYSELLGVLRRGSVVRYRTCYGAFFSWAMREGLTNKNPALEAKVPQGNSLEPRREINPFDLKSLGEVASEMEACAGRVHSDVVLFLGLTGLRWGELAALRVRDVRHDPYPCLEICRSKSDGMPLRNIPKGGKTRVVPLLDDAYAIIVRRLQGRLDQADALVFPAENGNFLSLSNWKRSARWKELSRGRTVKDLRHTFATNLLRAGTDLKTLQTWLGHASATLTADTYAHWMGADADRASIAHLNDQFRSESSLRGTPSGHEISEPVNPM